METKGNKYIAVAYKLYTVNGEKKEAVEETDIEHPFQFISGFGIAHPEFEKNVINLEKSTAFEFGIPMEQAFGLRSDEHILDLERSVFSINGHFDHEHIYPGAIVPMQNEDGNRFQAKVLEVGADSVKMDFNHPYAGYDLFFKGVVIESREATNDEIQGMINRMSGGGCCCGGHCDGDCGGNHNHDGGCGHHHGDGGECGCGHCH